MAIDSAAFARELTRRLEYKAAERKRHEIRPDNPLIFDFAVHDQVDTSRPLYEVNYDARLIDFWFIDGQRRTWESLLRFVAMIAGKQGGKTVFGPSWLHREIQNRAPNWHREKQEGESADFLAVSATVDLFKFKMLPAMKQYFCNKLKIGRYWAGDRLIEIKNPYTGQFGARSASDHEKMWARIILRTAESEAGMQSASALAAWADEAGLYSSTVWKDLLGRLSLNQGRALLTTTIYNLAWLEQLIYNPFLAGDPDIDVIQYASKDNPFWKEDPEKLRSKMESWEYERDYEAKFGGTPPGAIYEDFINAQRENGGHLVKRFVVPIEWPRYVAIDPGLVNPGKVWAAHDPHEDVFYIYRTEKGGERLSSEGHAKRDVAIARKMSERVVGWAIGAKSEIYWREDYTKAGAQNVRPPDVAEVWKGINRAIELLKSHRVYIFDDEDEFISEMRQYSRELDPDTKKPIQKIKDKSKFHLMDAFRYLSIMLVKGEPKRRTGKVIRMGYGG